VAAALKGAAGGSAAEIVGRVDREVLEFAAGMKQLEDVTVVVVKRRA
jgi:serine phosphatase RsbU (regulator of sigma subunit)